MCGRPVEVQPRLDARVVSADDTIASHRSILTLFGSFCCLGQTQQRRARSSQAAGKAEDNSSVVMPRACCLAASWVAVRAHLHQRGVGLLHVADAVIGCFFPRHFLASLRLERTPKSPLF